MATKRDYYEVLGVERTATVEIIEKTYRKLARQYHPDRNIGDPEAEVKFKEATEAHDILTNDEKRAVYDRYGHAGLENGGGGGGFPGGMGDLFGDLINNFFGGGGGRRQQQRGPRAGADIQGILDITLEEAAKGVKKSVTLQRREQCGDCSGKGSKTGKREKCKRCDGKGVTSSSAGFFSVQRECGACRGEGSVMTDPCPTCRGAGKVHVSRTIEVTVPAGVDTGLRLQMRGEGEVGDPGAPRGDLELVLRVADHPDFKRERDNLICAVPITFSQAALGAKIDIPTLLNKTSLTIPKGTQTHTEIRVPGEGMPNLRTGRKGDLRVMVVVETPEKLTKRQEELLRELAEIEHKEVSSARKSLFERIKGFFAGEEEEREKKAES
jgi:molecular chaperone DnaJ